MSALLQPSLSSNVDPIQADLPRATVCICTFNGADRLRMVFEALASQTLERQSWQLVVVDNASTDETSSVTRDLIDEFLPDRGRVVRESQSGLSFARARAVREAEGDILCFLDDDNVPRATFLTNVVAAFKKLPRAAVIGGKVLPRWAASPTPLAEAVAPFALAICDLGESAKLIDGIGAGIVGAGLCARRKVLQKIFRQGSLAKTVTDRTGANLISGGDLAISVMARQLGWDCWYEPSLVIEHCLPASRMQKDYLLRLFEGIGRGQAATRKVYDWKARSPLAWLVGLKDICRWQIGEWRGPSTKLRNQYPTIALDLHDLHQRLVCGRAKQAFGFPRN